MSAAYNPRKFFKNVPKNLLLKYFEDKNAFKYKCDFNNIEGKEAVDGFYKIWLEEVDDCIMQANMGTESSLRGY